jgi:hypothetical protein
MTVCGNYSIKIKSNKNMVELSQIELNFTHLESQKHISMKVD